MAQCGVGGAELPLAATTLRGRHSEDRMLDLLEFDGATLTRLDLQLRDATIRTTNEIPKRRTALTSRKIISAHVVHPRPVGWHSHHGALELGSQDPFPQGSQLYLRELLEQGLYRARLRGQPC